MGNEITEMRKDRERKKEVWKPTCAVDCRIGIVAEQKHIAACQCGAFGGVFVVGIGDAGRHAFLAFFQAFRVRILRAPHFRLAATPGLDFNSFQHKRVIHHCISNTILRIAGFIKAGSSMFHLVNRPFPLKNFDKLVL